MVAFDSAFLLIAIRKDAIPASVERAKERVDHLVSQLAQSEERILVPTPALSELLVHAGEAGETYLEELQKSAKFRIASFNTLAAVEVALDIRAQIRKGDKRGGVNSTWAKANFDRQIVAIAKTSGAHTIYSDDPDVEVHAKRFGLQVKRLMGLELPPSRTPLFDTINQPDGENGDRE